MKKNKNFNKKFKKNFKNNCFTKPKNKPKTILKFKLNDISKSLLEKGFFSENLPNSFNTYKLSEKINSLNLTIDKEYKIFISQPTIFSLYKEGLNRRTISIPNIASYLSCIHFIALNWAILKEESKSKNSHSKISNMESYDETIKLKKFKNKPKSPFRKSLEDDIIISMGNLYQLQIDISNFYNSIYTHSICWAVCGKSESKKFIKKQNTNSNLYKKFKIFNSFDILIRSMKQNETNGIITGPFTSRIFSEIIMSKIDKKLKEKDYIFSRYVDDFNIYFRNKHEIDDALNDIQKILLEYNLYLNNSKTKINQFPFNIIIDISHEFSIKYKKNGILGVLNHSMKLYNSGEIGAITYALKFISGKKIKNKGDRNNLENIFSVLINILFSFPKNGKYVIDFIAQNKEMFYKKSIRAEEVINIEIKKCTEGNKEHETILYLELLRKLNPYTLTLENFKSILASKNDLAIIICLYIYHKNCVNDKYNNKKKSVNGDSEKNESINQLFTELEGEDYSGERWFLIYYIRTNKYIFEKYLNIQNKKVNLIKELDKKIDPYLKTGNASKENKIKMIEFNNIFKKLEESKIQFYIPD